jgi:hypothetical protein
MDTTSSERRFEKRPQGLKQSPEKPRFLKGSLFKPLNTFSNSSWKRVSGGRARLQPCHKQSIQMRALAPEGIFLSAHKTV